jgi:formate/nitrite transporter FocA (FNT family)
MSAMGKDFGSKVMGVWWPSFAFVSLGFDHVVVGVDSSLCPVAPADITTI